MTKQVLDVFKQNGYASYFLWVLEGNPSIAVYEHWGGKRDGKMTKEIGGRGYGLVRYWWEI